MSRKKDSSLNERNQEVLRLFRSGMSKTKIAKQLGLKVRRVGFIIEEEQWKETEKNWMERIKR